MALARSAHQERLLAGEARFLSRELLVTQEKLKANQEIQASSKSHRGFGEAIESRRGFCC